MNIAGITGQAGSGKDTVADRLVHEHGYVKVALADPIKRFGHQVFGFTESQLWGPSDNRNKPDPRYDHYCRPRVAGVFGPKTNLKLATDCDIGWLAAAQALQAYAQEFIDEVAPGADVQSLYDWFVAIGSLYPRCSPRVILQSLGTEWGRQVAGEDIWVNTMVRNAQLVLNGGIYKRTIGVFDHSETVRPVGVVVSDVRFKNELAAIQAAGGTLIRVKRPETDNKAATTGIQGHASEMEQMSFSDKDFDVVINNNKTLDDLYKRIDKALEKL